MPRVLIVFGTTDGQTAKICYFLASELMTLGAEVELLEAGTRDADPADYDAVVVAASVHAGGYQRTVIRWAREHAAALEATGATFISVCLGVLEKNPKTRQDLDGILAGFAARSTWRPAQVKEVAGALKYTQYGWLKRMVMRYISGKAGGSTDTSQDHEYTDWNDLREFASTILVGRTGRRKDGPSVIPSFRQSVLQ